MKPTIFPAGHEIDLSTKLNVKFGIDPTSDQLHLGHLIPLLHLKKMWLEGHDVHIILGTFTAQLGDPSGKNEMRPIISSENTERNAQSILEQISRIFDNVDGRNSLFKKIHIHRNGDWFDRMSSIQMTELLSKFTVGQLLERDSFQKRMEQKNPIGIHELIVPILQGIDSVKVKADIEIGGVDQLFNFAITRDVQRISGQKPEICLLMPIINGIDGRKMSKSFGNCIFINDVPNDVFGKVMSISDTLMQEWWPIFFENEEINMQFPMKEKEKMATKITQLIWSLEEAQKAQEHFNNVIRNKKDPEVFSVITMNDDDTFVKLVSSIRNCSISEAKRLIGQGAVKVNGVKVLEENTSINFGDTIKIGKLDFAKVVS